MAGKRRGPSGASAVSNEAPSKKKKVQKKPLEPVEIHSNNVIENIRKAEYNVDERAINLLSLPAVGACLQVLKENRHDAQNVIFGMFEEVVNDIRKNLDVQIKEREKFVENAATIKEEKREKLNEKTAHLAVIDQEHQKLNLELQEKVGVEERCLEKLSEVKHRKKEVFKQRAGTQSLLERLKYAHLECFVPLKEGKVTKPAEVKKFGDKIRTMLRELNEDESLVSVFPNVFKSYDPEKEDFCSFSVNFAEKAFVTHTDEAVKRIEGQDDSEEAVVKEEEDTKAEVEAANEATQIAQGAFDRCSEELDKAHQEVDVAEKLLDDHDREVDSAVTRREEIVVELKEFVETVVNSFKWLKANTEMTEAEEMVVEDSSMEKEEKIEEKAEETVDGEESEEKELEKVEIVSDDGVSGKEETSQNEEFESLESSILPHPVLAELGEEEIHEEMDEGKTKLTNDIQSEKIQIAKEFGRREESALIMPLEIPVEDI